MGNSGPPLGIRGNGDWGLGIGERLTFRTLVQTRLIASVATQHCSLK
ncbi:hypothetical protein FDUTEX481_08821 [Tolypothrix sp. PCC 7601]|nr:hypothetical protein FDUTEX481_08821 [Tolypothrix sp. PCC 7601]